MNPFSLPIDEVFQRLRTSSNGLSEEEVLKRQKEFGKNVLKEEKTSVLKIFFRQFFNLVILVLLIASFVSLVIHEWTDFFVIIAIVLANGFIGFFQELKAESSIAALKKLTESKNEVLRGGKFLSVPSSELVPGDYIILYEGEAVTADIRLTDSNGLSVDESSLTGESVPALKDHAAILPPDTLPYDLKNMLLTGTFVVRGSGHGIVTKTGEGTYLASIAQRASEKSPETPLTRALNIFIRRYVVLSLAIFGSLGIVGHFQGRRLLDLSYLLLAGLVSVVPEGLPIVVTLVMVIGAQALSRKKTLIRYLPSVETLGSVTVLASDKTGTITEGKLIVREVKAKELEKIERIASLCNDSNGVSGDPLDLALCRWVPKCEEIRNRYKRTWAYPFDTRLRFMATVNQTENGEELLIKGAYETLREKAQNKEEFDDSFQLFLEKGLRVIAFGYSSWNQNPDPSSWDIHIAGLIGFLDPPKSGVKDAVEASKRAGIHVVMITGDHPETAKAVAREVEIWTEGSEILTGKEIDCLSDVELLEKLEKTTVLARILPEHKYKVVKLFQSASELVAVTGDGVNDVPALRAADIGIAMGGGTEAAKNIAKMVITDNNLKIIIEAIKNGRIIADNIRKVIYYLLSTSLQEITLLVLVILFSFPSPLSAIHILWINIVTDGVLDKMFPFAKEQGDVMERGPRRPETQFFDRVQLFRVVYFGGTVGLFCFFLYLYLLDLYSFEVVSTIIFSSVVVAQWANGVQAQKEKEPFFKNLKRSLTINPYIYIGLLMGVLLQTAVLYAAPGFFHSVSLHLEHWIYPALVFAVAFGLVEVRKWIEVFFSYKKL